MPRPEVIIVGGGVVGLSTAYYLSRHSTTCLLVDSQNPGEGATAVAAGVLSHQVWNPLDMQLVQFTVNELLRLPPRMRRRLRITRSGLVTIARAAHQVRVLEQVETALASLGVSAELMDATDAGTRLPALRWTDVSHALFCATDLCLDPVALAGFLRETVEGRGMTVLSKWPVAQITGGDGSLTVKGPKGVLPGEQVVVACGGATASILAGTYPPLPVRPYLAQLARFRSRQAVRLPAFHDLAQDMYGRPAAVHSILAGDGTETQVSPHRLRSRRPRPGFVRSIRKALQWRLPNHTFELTQAWSGLCDATPDRRPLIGPVPGMAGCFVACGFQGFGLMRSLAVGEYLAARLTGRRPRNNLERYAPARFTRRVRFTPREGFTLDTFETG